MANGGKIKLNCIYLGFKCTKCTHTQTKWVNKIIKLLRNTTYVRVCKHISQVIVKNIIKLDHKTFKA